MGKLFQFIAIFFVNRFTRTRRGRYLAGDLSRLLGYVNDYRSSLNNVVRLALIEGTDVVLPPAPDNEYNGITLSATYCIDDLHRMVITVMTCGDKRRTLLMEVLRQALLEDDVHYDGSGTREIVTADGQRGYAITINGAHYQLVKEYKAAARSRT